VTLRRLYVPSLPDKGGAVTLGEGAARHARVLRLRQGDEVELFDGAGRLANARIVSVAGFVECEAAAPVIADVRATRVVLMLAIPKGSTLDDCVRMATELGVDEVALMQAERSVPRWDESRARSRIERLTRVAAEAAAQSERADLPIIHGPASCPDWIARLPEDALGVVFGARAEGALRVTETPEQIWCAVGPEGGFADDELAAFQRAGFVVGSLGRSILRVDTAVAAALTLVQDRIAALQPR
jgi:16S rRNA (uracil1498-N3)-methyltransferase